MKPKKPRNPAARPRGTLRVDPDASDRDPLHGCALLHASEPLRSAGADVRLHSTARGWTVVLRSGPTRGSVLAEAVSYHDARLLVDALVLVVAEVLAKR